MGHGLGTSWYNAPMCTERVRASNSFETQSMFCVETEGAVSLPLTNGYVDQVWTRIILWWKGYITKTATCKGVLPAATPHCSTWAFQMWTSLTILCIRNAAEVTEVEEQQMSSGRNMEVDKLNKMSYVRIVFILAHGVLKCNLQSKRRMINTGFDWPN